MCHQKYATRKRRDNYYILKLSFKKNEHLHSWSMSSCLKEDFLQRCGVILNYKILKEREGRGKRKQGFAGHQALPVGFCWTSVTYMRQHTYFKLKGTNYRGSRSAPHTAGREARYCRLLRLQCKQMWERLGEALAWTFFSPGASYFFP